MRRARGASEGETRRQEAKKGSPAKAPVREQIALALALKRSLALNSPHYQHPPRRNPPPSSPLHIVQAAASVRAPRETHQTTTLLVTRTHHAFSPRVPAAHCALHGPAPRPRRTGPPRVPPSRAPDQGEPCAIAQKGAKSVGARARWRGDGLTWRRPRPRPPPSGCHCAF